MAETPSFLSQKRYAVVTGGNRGIGLEICRQLASQGVMVILTARNAKRGLEALEKLKNSGISSTSLEFHQLDVTDSASVASLADFIQAKFGKLDILVNNAGVLGVICDFDALKSVVFSEPSALIKYADSKTETYEMAVECLETNYFGVKKTTEGLLPLLGLSDSPRIVNVSSMIGQLKYFPNERVRGILGDAENLPEERVDALVKEFLVDFKDGLVAQKGWPEFETAYSVSKAALNAYTRILAKKYPSFIINCLCPGYVSTDINGNTGPFPIEEGGKIPARLALMPHGSPSGLFFIREELSSF